MSHDGMGCRYVGMSWVQCYIIVRADGTSIVQCHMMVWVVGMSWVQCYIIVRADGTSIVQCHMMVWAVGMPLIHRSMKACARDNISLV